MGSISKLKYLIYILVTIGFLYLWTQVIDLSTFFVLAKNANYGYIILAIILNLVQSYLSSYRVKLLFLSQNAKLNILDIWTGGWLSALITSFLPFYSGGFVYSYLLAKKAKISYKKTFLLLLVDMVMGIINVFALALVPILRTKYLKYYTRAVFLSIVTFIVGAVVAYLYFLAFGLTLPIFEFLMAHFLFMLVSLVPGPPLKIGQYELSGILVFGYFLALDKNLVSAAFTMQHIVSLALISVVGLFSAYLTKYDFKKK